MDGISRARQSLRGLWLGDCFGEQFFGDSTEAYRRIKLQELTPGPWRYTDDTEMALSVVEQLVENQRIDQDALVARFAERMDARRGYGEGAYRLLLGVREGKPWRALSQSGFRGMGSFGNGAAMRVAPLGAFFAEAKLDLVVAQARSSAEVTHAHPEGISGAIAVAVGAALAGRGREDARPLGRAWLEAVRDAMPAGYTRSGIDEALSLPDQATIVEAAAALGNGSGVTAPDTVPLCLWVAAKATNVREALWTTVAALGDRDTTCAIVAGILGARWDLAAVEDLTVLCEPIPSHI